MRTGIIIPCYNEANRLDSKAFKSFILSNDDYHLCFVNDGSSDKTMEVLKSIQTGREDQVSIIDMKKNSGKASAVRSGARYLYNRTDIDYIGFIDADLSTDFNDFTKLVESINSNKDLQIVYGSRGKGNGSIERNPIRMLFSKIIKVFTGMILGLPISDTQCGAKVFTRDIIPVAYNQPFITQWLFDVEIFIRLKNYFGRDQVMNHLYEQPLQRWVHMDDSKLGIRDAVQIPLKLISIWLNYGRLKQLTNFPILNISKASVLNAGADLSRPKAA